VPANQAQALMCYEKAAQLGHAKSMNLYGRYLEQGIATAPARRGRCAGIGVRPRRGFSWMFSLALVLVERGQVAEAAPWLERARIEGN
jgi:TPR repeat protein